ncbi:hypothetical protein [Methylobacterium sp. AMS5]|uniref:hypothetical protein n=1 Tax=Methylobacterium sp. AMS5 TaxID=925818 RepID=UPI00074FAA87|nr:hypothetical protein [Methylobacterium sp. AMS5]AMB48353.1 hypothetical protein Y590_25630 [Methylobacterium sp. AMS5]
MPFAEEFQGLIGQEALLQGVYENGRVFRINGMPFEVTTGAIEGRRGPLMAVSDVHYTPEHEIAKASTDTSGVMIVGNGNFIDIQDLWVDVIYIRLRTGDDAGPAYQHQRLNPSQPWKARDRNDYIGRNEYDMLVADLAQRIKPRLQEEARQRVEFKREQIRLAQEAERKELEAIVVTREDLGEDNASWGMF